VNQVLFELAFPSGHMLQLLQGDITADKVDAIVNAANSHLQHGGGVAGIISRKGGLAIQRESDFWVREHGPVSHAEPAVTSGGDLPCRYVIHAVGPVWGEGDEDKKLVDAVTGSLLAADRLELASIAMPAISTGIFGFPKERAAGAILSAIERFFIDKPESTVSLVQMVLYDQPTLEAFTKVWGEKGWGK
jgi:O-acetyl-ADP-ribose deacetylase (regulator of RNase III)